MSNVLQFSLGLSTGAFLGGIGTAKNTLGSFTNAIRAIPGASALAGLAAGALSAGAVFEKTFEQIEKGAALKDLSARTGESVENLYSLQRAFMATGLEAGKVPDLLFQMQKSVGGISEAGEPTKDVFASLGLDIEKLKSSDGPAAMQEIFEKLGQLSNADASNVAAKIFGRGGAQDALQAARQAGEFKDALVEAGAEAKRFGANAERFDQVTKGLDKLKLKSENLFLGLAEAAAPAVNGIISQLNQIDFSRISEEIGRIGQAGFQAFKDGELGEYLYLGLAAGVEKVALFTKGLLGSGDFWSGIGQVALGGFAALGKGLIEIYMGATDVWRSMQIKAVEELVAMVGNSKLGAVLGLNGAEARSFREIFNAERGKSRTGMDAIFGTNDEFFRSAFGFIKDGTSGMKTALAEAVQAAAGGEMGAAFQSKLGELMTKFQATTEQEVARSGLAMNPAGKVGQLGAGKAAALMAPSLNGLERIGAGFGGRTGLSQEHLRLAARQASLQERMAKSLQVMEQVVSRTQDISKMFRFVD